MEATAGFEPAHRGFADPRVNQLRHVATCPGRITDQLECANPCYTGLHMEHITGTVVDHSDKPSFEYSQITDQILLGTNACCRVHFDKGLVDMGVRGDISLEQERLDEVQEVEFFLWLPVEDHTPPSMAQLRVGTQALKELVDVGEKVYVHCRNGHGRGPSLVIAYFILLGDDYDTAFYAVQSKRSVIHLDVDQIERLKEFEHWCRTEHGKDAE